MDDSPSTDSIKGMRLPQKILYCHGLGSSIQNRTAQYLTKYFANSHHYFECLRYSNPGSPDRLWRVSEWRKDIENRIKDDQWIVIATSAGAHCAMNAAVNRPQNVKGLFLFCPGSGLDLSYIDTAVPNGRSILENGGTVVHPASRNGTEVLLDFEGLKEFMDTCVCRHNGPIPINCPISIVHGTEDTLVPVENSIRLTKRFTSNDVQLQIVNGGTHFLEITEDVLQHFEDFLAKFKGDKLRSQI